MDQFDMVAHLLKGSENGIAFTGAGVSTESGIPDFRGSQGLGKKFDPKMASRSYFIEDPLGFWDFYSMRYEAVTHAKPNAAHGALAFMELKGLIRTLITQNIDGLHSKAGSISVIELYGNIIDSRCDSCGYEESTSMAIKIMKETGSAPRCRICEGWMRPSLVLFEEPVPLMEAAMDIASQSDLCLVMGSSLLAYPAASIPEEVKNQGGLLVIVNKDPTPLDYAADVLIRSSAALAMENILKML